MYNLGTGVGYSVLQMVKAFEKASGKPVPYQVVGRRSGDVATVYAATDLAAEELGWKADRGLDDMCMWPLFFLIVMLLVLCFIIDMYLLNSVVFFGEDGNFKVFF